MNPRLITFGFRSCASLLTRRIAPLLLVMGASLVFAQGSITADKSGAWKPVTQVDPLPTQTEAKYRSASAKAALRSKYQPAGISLQLSAPDAFEKLIARKAGVHDKKQQVGFGRNLPAEYRAPLDLGKLTWATLPDGGQSAIFTIASPEAVALRVAISIGAAAPGIELRFFSPDHPDVVFGPYLAAEEIKARQQIHPKLAASFNQAVFWSPTVEGSSIGIEISLPPGVDKTQLEITVPMVSHFFVSAHQPSTQSLSYLPKVDTSTVGAAMSCEVDEVCYTSNWGNTGASIARLSFVEGANAYWCSGTLLNNVNQDHIPYLLTANHCINDSAAASTVISTWFFQSSTCNSGAASSSAIDTVNGAQLLATGTDTDFTLLQLYDAPPGGATFAGWSVDPLVAGTATVGIHHPKGDMKKIMFSNFAQYQSWNGLTSPSSHIQVNGTLGYTEGGSSGSGLFVADSNNVQRLVGQLHGGIDATCGGTAYDLYGRFDSTYNSIGKWLAPSGLLTKVDVRSYMPTSASNGFASYLRIINTGNIATPVSVAAVDGNTGVAGSAGQLIASLPAGATQTFSASQIETALGTRFAATDRPRIRVSALPSATIETQSFLLQPGGAFNEVSGALRSESVEVRTYVPAAAATSGYVSSLRIINTGNLASPVTVAKIDPTTGVVGTAGTLATIPAGAAVTFTAAQIEAALGISIPASERPRMRVAATNTTLDVQSYLSQPNGALTEVSSGQAGWYSIDVRSYVPAATPGYASFLRIINVGTVATPITATVLDPGTGLTGASGVVIASLAPSAAMTLSSAQVEQALGTSIAAASRPRIRLSSPTSDLRVQSFLMQPGGAFNEVSNAISGTSVVVRTYVPAADKGTGYTSYLRVINTGTTASAVNVALVDGTTGVVGMPQTLLASLPGGAAQTFNSDQIEAALGIPIASGARPRIQVSGATTLEVQSYLTQPGGAFTEVSGAD